MNSETPEHPSDQTLHEFGLGKLAEARSRSVAEHLEGCPTCLDRVSMMSSDSFLGRLQEAHRQTATRPPAPLVDGPSRSAEPGPAGPDAAPTTTIDHPDYEILRELGRGGMGVVFLAHNRLMDRDEVLKVVGRHLMDREEVLDRFTREIRSAARLSHPNIVHAYSAFRTGDSVVFAMEYVDGLDLAKLVRAKGPLPVPNACYFAYQAALGLQHAHEQGMVHRDIKPGNLVLARKGDKAVVKVLDFGLAKATRENPLDGGLTNAGQMLGTPDFIAPEQIRDAQSAGIHADIYSLGCTLYYLLTAGPPFQAASLYDLLQAHFSMNAPPLNLARPEVPVELAALVGKMMAKEPGRRFQTPNEVAAALRPFFKSGASRIKTEMSQAGRTAFGGATSGETASRMERAANIPEPDGRPSDPARTSSIDERSRDSNEGRDGEHTTETTPDAPKPRLRWILPASAAGLLVSLLLGAWAAGILRVQTKDGLIVLEDIPPRAEVYVDGEKVTVAAPDGSGPAEIKVAPGRRGLQVKKGGFETFGEQISVAAGGKTDIRVRLVPITEAPAPGVPQVAGNNSGGTSAHLLHTTKDSGAYEVNLIKNPGCEDDLTDSKIPSWHVVSGNWCLGSDVQAFDGKRYFFAGGCQEAELRQDVDVGSFAEAIDAGIQAFKFLGLMRSWNQTPPDQARILIDYLDASKTTVLEQFDSWTTANVGDWEPTKDVRLAPKTTRWLRIRLISRRIEVPNNESNDGYFDALSLKAIDPSLGPNSPTAFDENLIGNPGGEELPRDSNVPSWIPIEGPWIAANDPHFKPFEGRHFFRIASSARYNADAVLQQTVDVRGFGKSIDAGGQAFRFLGHARGGDDQHHPSISIHFLDESKTKILDRFDSGPVSSSKDWKPIELRDKIAPKSTRWIQVRLASPFVPRTYASFNEGYFDAISLIAVGNPDPGARGKPAGEIAGQEPSPARQVVANSIGMKLALIPAGEFLMGSPDSDLNAEDREKQQHRVRIARPFYLGIYEVTQRQFKEITDHYPSRFGRVDDYPVERVTWKDAAEFCNLLSRQEGLEPYYRFGAGEEWGGNGYRLPKEAEWEYACRAGSTTKYFFGDRWQDLGEYAWYSGNSKDTVHPVGQKKPNAFGLFDMYGNVSEYCEDAWGVYENSTILKPPDRSVTAVRAGRGGSKSSEARYCRSATRFDRGPSDNDEYGGNWGFRVARDLDSRELGGPSIGTNGRSTAPIQTTPSIPVDARRGQTSTTVGGAGQVLEGKPSVPPSEMPGGPTPSSLSTGKSAVVEGPPMDNLPTPPDEKERGTGSGSPMKVVESLFGAGDDEGWTTRNPDGSRDGTSKVVVEFGNGNHFLSVDSVPDGKEWGWHAPTKFHGDHSDAFGKTLGFGLFSWDAEDQPVGRWNVVLSGARMILYLADTDLDSPAPRSWTHYYLTLGEAGRWKKSLGGRRWEPAKDEDIKRVLSAVTDLRIRGEFTEGRTRACLDNVTLGSGRPPQGYRGAQPIVTVPETKTTPLPGPSVPKNGEEQSASGPSNTPTAVDNPLEIPLKDRGLKRSGSYFVVATEAEVLEKFQQVRPLMDLMAQAFGKYALVLRNEILLAEAQETYAAMTAQVDAASATLSKMPSGGKANSLENQEYQAAREFRDGLARGRDGYSATVDAIRGQQASASEKADLGKDFLAKRSAFPKASAELRPPYDKAIAEYKALQNDPKVKAALDAVRGATRKPALLGPSRDLQKAIETIKEAERASAPETAPTRRDRKAARSPDRKSSSKASGPPAGPR